MLKLGHSAPNFKAQAYHDGAMKDLSMADFKGKWTVLFFYPLDFTFVCPTELRAFAKMESDFSKLGASLVACSTDSVYSHKAWFETDLKEVKYPVLADYTKEISRAYEVLNEDTGFANRGTFLIDPEGKIRYAVISDGSVGRSTQETLRALQAVQSGELCPADWTPGEDTIKK